ncbi:MAG: HD domain-containing protein [Gemmatimonadota bacterium]|nr:HD domain-containing protein [Gemmatimonadota bacterium]
MDERIFRALEFAAEKHKLGRRKGGRDIPYINHPIAVARLLATVGGVTDPDVLAAAFLHDTVEDTDTTPAELVEHFGSEIAGLVAEVTDDPRLASAERKLTQEREAASKSPRAKLIRLSDKTCNVHDITFNPPPDWSVERRMEYFNWAERVVGKLRGVHPVMESFFDATVAKARRVTTGD